jgi:hypothetical protein
MDNYRCYLSTRVQNFLSPLGRTPCEVLLIEYLGLLLRMRILVVVPPVVGLSMVVPPSSIKPVLVLSLILVWQVYPPWPILPPCSAFWSQPSKTGDILCASLLPVQNFHLYNLGDQLPHTLLEVCSAHEDKVEIKCMGSVGEETPIEPKLYLFLYSLRHIVSW